MPRSDVLVALVLAALLTAPAWTGGLIGSPNAETYGHAWVWWWAAEQWPAWPTGTSLALHTEVWPVIDPLPTWIFAGIARVVGPTLAWNLAVAAGVMGAALGGAALSRAAGGVGLIGAIGVPLMPIWLGSITSGLTEDLAIGLVAGSWALALRGRWVAAGVMAGVTALCGLYLGWFAGIGLLVLAARAWRQWRGWLVGGLLAALIATPAAWSFRARLGGEGHRNVVVAARPEPLWRVNPWHGADLASFVTPGRIDTGGAIVRQHPTWLGAATVTLAALAGPSPAWLAVVGSVLVAPGPQLSWAGTPLGMENPALPVFQAIPMASRFNHHARVMLLGQLVLVTLASRGARRFPRAAGLAMLADAVLLNPAPLPLPTTPTAAPPIYAAIAALPEGPVAVLGERNPQKPLFDQRFHRRRLWLDPNRPQRARLEAGVLVVVGDDRQVRADHGAPDVTAEGGAAWLLP